MRAPTPIIEICPPQTKKPLETPLVRNSGSGGWGSKSDPHESSQGNFLRGGNGRGGFHTPVRGTMFVRNGAVTPGPSRECDITFFVKRRPKSARQSRDSTVAARRVQSVTIPSSRVSRKCRYHRVKVPPVNQERTRHINLRKSAGHRPGVPGTLGGDKQGSTGQCPRDFLLFALEKLAVLSGHRPGVAGTPGLRGGFQTFYVMCLFCSLVIKCPIGMLVTRSAR